jgi:hypothetical protein
MTATQDQRPRGKPTISARLEDGRLAELVVAANGETSFAVWSGSSHANCATIPTTAGHRLVPYSRDNSLLQNRIVLFPSEPAEYGTKNELLQRISAYVARYMDLSPSFAGLVAHYVLLTWLYDHFNELPYLRLRGDFGSGKTRFLLVVGSICYKPIFASGASTVSPIFHMLDAFGGTLLIDEADFRFSDEKAQIVKILNNGNARGFPVLRTESKNGHEFSPRAFNVFGPKLVAMRGQFDDPALESRFVTERSDRRALRADIPINLPTEQSEEALALRNQLLMFRFKNHATRFDPSMTDQALEPRLRQIFGPLQAMIDDTETKAALRRFAGSSNDALLNERGASLEAEVLTVLRVLVHRSDDRAIPLRDIARTFAGAFSADYGHSISHRWIGDILRKRLSITTQKSHGVFGVPLNERKKLKALWERYGVTEEDATQLAGKQLPRDAGGL